MLLILIYFFLVPTFYFSGSTRGIVMQGCSFLALLINWLSNLSITIVLQKNKWDFFMFLVLEVSAMIITGVVTIASTCSLKLVSLWVYHAIIWLTASEKQKFPAAIVKDPSPPSFGGWLNHNATEHLGALSFLIMDFFLFFGVAVLTVVQASQVCN